MIPLWSKDPAPDHAVLLRPITWRVPRLRELPDPTKRAPYPRLWTIFTRGAFCVAEAPLAAFVQRYRTRAEREGWESGGVVVAVAGIAIACALDGLITLAAIAGVYDATAHAVMVGADLLDIALCIAGIYYLSSQDLKPGWGFLGNELDSALIITGIVMRYKDGKKAKMLATEGGAAADIELEADLPAAHSGADAAVNKLSVSSK
ncbi:hypothetical protein N0V88_007794 [Collariella sp. IMI 366227]|nr:hypothetical protein N0V88_007794 [Collariella sp. IMI 366227]